MPKPKKTRTTPHPLAVELVNLKERLVREGLTSTASRLEIAVRAIGWEIAYKLPPNPLPVNATRAERMLLAKWHRQAKAIALKELEKLPHAQ